MPVDNEAIRFIDNPDMRLAIWPELDGFCSLTVADSDHPEGLPALTELKCAASDLHGLFEGKAFEVTNGAGTIWLEPAGERIKVSYSGHNGDSVGYGLVDALELKHLLNTALSVI